MSFPLSSPSSPSSASASPENRVSVDTTTTASTSKSVSSSSTSSLHRPLTSVSTSTVTARSRSHSSAASRLLHAVFATVLGISRLPLWTLYYLPRATRPHPLWSWRQAVTVQILRYYLHHVSVVRYVPKLSLQAGLEGKRWIVMPAVDELCVGVAEGDGKVMPGVVGGTWYPERLDYGDGSPASDQTIMSSKKGAMSKLKAHGKVALHFHGGGYILGTGRTMDAGFGANLLLKDAGVSHVLCPQYRLSSTSSPTNKDAAAGRFPAALQDAIASYSYLVNDLGIQAKDIVVSGDSAGGNLVLALLRYIAELHSPSTSTSTTPDNSISSPSSVAEKLPHPSCAWLWSPWVDICKSLTPATNFNERSPNASTDILASEFLIWASRAFCGIDDTNDSHDNNRSNTSEIAIAHSVPPSSDPYINPLHHPFSTPVPLWIQTGESEVLSIDDARLADKMERVRGNRVELWIERNAIHDVCLLGAIAGFGKEASRAAKMARRFMEEVDSVDRQC